MTYKYSPKVTVLMSVYNGERYLNEAIDSILAQTFTDFEFLIIDDASTDNSLKIISGYTDDRIKVIQNNENLGLTKSLNKGLALAEGEYIARIDADDISYPERLEVQYNYLKKHPEVGIAGSWTELIDGSGSTIDYWQCQYSPEDIYYILNFRNCLTHSSIMINRKLLMNAGGYFESADKAQDFELWNRLSKITKIYQIQTILVKWRRAQQIDAKRYQQKKTVEYVIRRNLESLLSDEVGDQLVKFFIKNFEYCSQNNHSMYNTKDIRKIIYQIKKVNSKIIENAPDSLNRKRIRQISDKYAMNYCAGFSKKIGLINSIKCLHYLANNKIIIPYFVIKHSMKRVIL